MCIAERLECAVLTAATACCRQRNALILSRARTTSIHVCHANTVIYRMYAHSRRSVMHGGADGASFLDVPLLPLCTEC